MEEFMDIAHRLQQSGDFPHPIGQPTLLETHISWVLLTGEYAYKIKKPLVLPFVDYSTLANRKHFCEEEFRLNHPAAPDIYVGVAPIVESAGRLLVEGDGKPIEYCVKMREFPQNQIFARLVEDDTLSRDQIDALAELLAQAHSAADACSDSMSKSLVEAFRLAVRDAAVDLEDASLASWLNEEFSALQATLNRRANQGQFRCCHGDLHLENLVWFQDRVQAFDCIEFSDPLRQIDVISDAAFPVMDLLANDRPDLAFRLLSGYLEQTEDYPGLQILPLCIAYRAAVRAMCHRLKSDHAKSTLYEQTATKMMNRNRPSMFITHGVSGSGKSFHSMNLVEREQAIRIRSDVVRAKMFRDATKAERYAPNATEQVYRRLLERAEQILKSGFSVAVDASFLQRSFRRQFAELAEQLDATFHILVCEADLETLRSRIRSRRNDPSEATPELVEQQRQQMDPLNDEELNSIYSVRK